MHQIGEVAEAVGLSLRTIRDYEEGKLVPPSGRSAGGLRLYTDSDIERLRLVKHMKPLDLTIDEMRDLPTTRDQLAEERCKRLRDQLEAGETISRTLRAEVSAARATGRPRR